MLNLIQISQGLIINRHGDITVSVSMGYEVVDLVEDKYTCTKE